MVIGLTRLAPPGYTEGMLAVNPRIRARVVRALWVSGFRVTAAAQALAPVLTSRMKLSIMPRQTAQFEVFIGTNVRSRPSRAYPQGYLYPVRQEFDQSLRHPRGGQAAFLRTGLRRQARRTAKLLRAAVVGGFRGGRSQDVASEEG